MRSIAKRYRDLEHADVVELAALCRLYGVDLLDFLRSAGLGPRR